MKELIKKFTALFGESLEKLENNQVKEAVEKMKELTPIVEEIAKAEVVEKEEIEKTVKEEIKKYVDLHISADDLPTLMEQIKQATSTIEEIQKENESLKKELEDLKKEKQEDDKVVEKTLNNLVENVEKISSVLTSKVE